MRAVPGTSRWYKHPVDVMAFKQLEYMNKGMSEEEGIVLAGFAIQLSSRAPKLLPAAYAKMESDMHDRQVAAQIEAQLATQQAELLGITATPIGECGLFTAVLSCVLTEAEMERAQQAYTDAAHQWFEYSARVRAYAPIHWIFMRLLTSRRSQRNCCLRVCPLGSESSN